MEYTEFVERVGRELNGALPRTLQGAEIHPQQVNKPQGDSYYGVVLTPKDSQMGVTLDLTSNFERLKQGTDFQTILREIAVRAENALKEAPAVNISQLTDYEQMKEKLMIQVISADRNREMLESVPHLQKEDIAAVCRFVFPAGIHGDATILVTNAMLDLYGISKEKLLADAMEYSLKNYPASIRGMNSLMSEMMGIDKSMMPETEEVMYVASCNNGSNGAGCIFYPDFFREAAEKLGGDFYILPSSIHEVLLVSASQNFTVEELKNTVREVNGTEVQPKDRLSDNVYYYDAQNQTFGIASPKTEQKVALLKDRLPVYDGSYLDAVKLHEQEQWKASFAENKQCRIEVEQLMVQEPLPENAAQSLIEKFGFNRTGYILANSVQQMGKGFSKENAEWAESIYICKDKTRQNNYTLQIAAAGRAEKLDALVTQFLAEVKKLNLFQADVCEPDYLTADLTGKVLVLKPTVLKESCLIPENQLWLATGGFGCDAKSSGRAVMATCLSDGEHCRWNRQDFCGVIQQEHLPEWAKQKLEDMNPQPKMEM